MRHGWTMRRAWTRAMAALALFGALCAPAGAQAPEPERRAAALEPAASGDEPVEVQAAQMDYDRGTGWITATGGVTVRRGGQTLKADRARVNSESGEAIAEGNVWFERAPGEKPWTGSVLKHNFKTGEGSISNMAGMSDPFVVRTDKAVRQPDGTYLAHGAEVTTCTNRPGHQHYRVRSGSLTLTPGNRLVGRHCVFYAGPVPVFYWPYWWRDLDEPFGWYFYPGYNSRMGAYLLSSYSFRVNPYVRSETHVDYRQKRGVAFGQDFSWREPGEERRWTGLLKTYYLEDDRPIDDDDDPVNEELDNQRYRVRFKHEHTLGERDYLLTSATYLSDRDVEEDFFRRYHRRVPQPDNHAVYTYRDDRYTANLTVRKRLNEFYDEVDRLPQMGFDFPRQQLGESAFYYEGSSSAGYLERLHRKGSSDEDYAAFRIDSAHMIYRPDRRFGFLNLIPRAGYRATYYSETFETVTRTAVAAVSTTNRVVLSGGGTGTVVNVSVRTNTVSEAVVLGPDLRSLLEVGYETSFKAFKTWEGGILSPLRHVVEPYADYTYVLEPSLTPDRIYQFDDIDALGKENNIKFGTRNKFQTLRDAQPWDILDLNVYTWYRLEDETGGKQGLEDLFAEAEYRPGENVDVEVDARYDTDISELQTVNARLRIRNAPYWNTGTELRYVTEKSTLLYQELTLFPNRPWSLNAYTRYEFETSRAEEYGGYLQRNLDCMGLRLRASVEPSYTRGDGSEADTDINVLFELWLTAFPDMERGGTDDE